MAFYDLAADGQADAGTGVILAGMEPLKHLKNTFKVLWLDADPVILDGKDPIVPTQPGADLNLRLALVAVFNGVSDQILKELGELRAIT